MEKLKVIDLYIGANNRTKKCEINKALKVLDKKFIGYSILKGIGRFNKVNENSFIVRLIETPTAKYNQIDIANTIMELKEQLQQQSILYSEYLTNARFM